MTVVPGLFLGLIGFGVFSLKRDKIIDVALDPTALLWVVVVIGVVWSLWVSLIWKIYARNRSRTATLPFRVLGAAGVGLMCLAVSAPMAVGARYAVVQRDVVHTVFGTHESATTPKQVTKANPWGHRDRVNVLLLGGDGGIDRQGIRTDSVILASISVKTGSTTLFSFPRNLQNVPFKAGSPLAKLYPSGFTDGTPNNAEYFLNAVYRNIPALHPGVLGKTDNEGADAVKLAVEGATGIPVDYYVLVNLDGFSKLVDVLGGITVNINEPIPMGGNTDLHIPPKKYLQPGPNRTLNGYQALWYTRGRYGSTDYKRMARQRCAINAIVKKASPALMLRKYVALAEASKDIVRTDIPSRLLHAFVDLAGLVKGKPIRSVGFERSAAFDPNDPDFAYVRAAVYKALHPTVHHSSTGGATSSGGSGDSVAGDPGDTTPSKASDTNADCAYHPVAQ
ncbi:LCP family protein [Nocardioides marmorisolisilvae]|uniref:LytR family transcriptional regulator n=1 Tax=Nocardioides marmorisolisilvae TaxID=1542737 RepID=A0A3N0DPV0_9ACTN|nr:LCP family protein [Nocardioides marmorisolisilvae]RNL77664.1 LytR family transcriptional regulator [Nocardioides marmorisolisilvae]